MCLVVDSGWGVLYYIGAGECEVGAGSVEGGAFPAGGVDVEGVEEAPLEGVGAGSDADVVVAGGEGDVADAVRFA